MPRSSGSGSRSGSTCGPRSIRNWLIVLIAWPMLLFVMPWQDPLIQLVGLRGSIFLLPFILLGARLTGDDVYKLALWFAV